MSANIRLSPVAGAPRRKNGRQQACDPCRRRKVACDHRLPICSRCKRGRIPEKCVYIPLEPSESDPVSPNRSNAKSPAVLTTSDLTVDTPRTNASTGFLGATSFPAFYQESPSPLLGSESQEPLHQSPEVALWANHSPDVLSDLASRTLRAIPDQASAEALMEVDSTAHDGWCRLVGERLHASFWSVFGRHLNGDRHNGSIMQVVRKLHDNTTKLLKEDQADPEEWIASFAGAAIRWESLGHLFVYWSYGARGIQEIYVPSKCKDLQETGALELMKRYKTCAAWCMELSRVATRSNTLLAYLVYKHCLLESQISGETSLAFWRAHGDIISLATFLGLHASPNTAFYDCSISVQMHRRLFASIFSHDKTAATFTGRPPFLSRRFVSTPLPLDIADEELLKCTKEDAPRQLKLDANGWNTNGEVYGTTYPRSRATLAFIRDEILEFALQSQQYCSDNIKTLTDLKRRAVEAMATIPSGMVYHPEDMTCKAGLNKRNIANKFRLRLDHLQNMFLIERLLSKQGDQDCGCGLFDTSLEMISLALILWTHQKRVDYPETCLDWLVMSYAAPAGGVLCMQLLKCDTPPARRAAIIEKLSMLVSFLDWVTPAAPNYAIGKGVQHAVRRTIEKSLEPPIQGRTEATQDVTANGVAEAAENFDGIFNFDLLDTFDWLRPDAAAAAVI